MLLHLQDYQTDSRTGPATASLGSPFDMKNQLGSPFDMKKPLSNLIASSDPTATPTGGHGHAFSHYSQMGFKSHMMGGAAAPGFGGMGGGGGVAPRPPSMNDWFGKMMSFSSSCQSPGLPPYYPNSMYSTEKIDSHV